jgi:hypothetical protein
MSVVPVSAMAVCGRETATPGAAVELLPPVLLAAGSEKPEASNCQKPLLLSTSTKERSPVNSVGSMKPKL